ncbi:MAG: hypothetical protein ACKOGP_08905 [Bacteroidota bacterium]
MMKIVLKKWSFCLLLLMPLMAHSQMYKVASQAPQQQCDSLVNALNAELDQADSLLNAQSIELQVLKQSADKKEESLRKMERFVEVYKSENQQMNQTNKILIIFNCLGAVLLLLALVYIMSGRNKARRPETSVPPVPPTPYPTVTETPVAGRTAVGVEDRLIQIERLARLREGGLLSTNEFEKEKERILRGG